MARRVHPVDRAAALGATDNQGSEVAEIVAALGNGRGLVYSDSDAELIGFVDLGPWDELTP